MSLIEIMVVIGLMALLATMAMPGIGSYFRTAMSSTTRELASTVKQAYNSAVMTGQVHRLAFDLKAQEYWVESGPASVTLDTKESIERRERRNRYRKDGEKETGPDFQMEKSVTKKKIALSRGVTFEDVQNATREEPFTEGTVYTHFFPNGVIEQTLVHLKDESKHFASLVILPLIGKTDYFDRRIPFNEAFPKK